MDARSTVLLVEADPEERERYAAWLQDDGREVIACSGPSGPDYTCVGSRERACPLVADSDIVVLDMSTEAEALMTGTASEELLALYLISGRPVVALGSYPAEGIPGELVRMGRHPERETLLGAIAALEDDHSSIRTRSTG
jgi:CheY-like chemotaxis protein